MRTVDLLLLLAVLAGGVSCAPPSRPDASGDQRTDVTAVESAGVSIDASVAPSGAAPGSDLPTTAPRAPTTASEASSPADVAPGARPAWLGTRVLVDGPRGWPEPVDTPPELRDRRLPPRVEVLPTPPDDAFVGRVAPVTDDVLARSTWHDGCPVGRDELAHVVVSHWGFDDRHHTGELLVHTDVADDVVTVFSRLHAARFPLEEVAITTREDLAAPPTGDGNVTAAFVCRATRGSGSWSAHARGLAIDVNPFHNPYVRDGRVLPELATAYTDRDDQRPGMVHAGDVVTAAFADVGWTWGGDFRSFTDPMHFSATGR